MADTFALEERTPDVRGAFASGWLWAIPPDIARGGLAMWFLRFNITVGLVTPRLALTLITLRDLPGLPEAHRHYPEAEYELHAAILDPRHPLPGLTEPRPAVHYLSPPVALEQFHDVPQGDTGARRLARLFARAVEHGHLLVDDGPLWRKSLDGTLEHMRAGMHPITSEESAP